MIEAKDVRVENKVLFGIVPVTIKGIHTQKVFHEKGQAQQEHFYVDDFVEFSQYYAVDGYNLDPLPLTEDILLKCGFEVDEDAGNWHSPEHTIYRTKGFRVGIKDDYIGWYNQADDDFYSSFYPQLHYLHQLQNLYFALTQTELNYKP